MKAATEPAACAAIPLRFPAWPIGGLAGTSFKHEHLPAIQAQASQDGFFAQTLWSLDKSGNIAKGDQNWPRVPKLLPSR